MTKRIREESISENEIKRSKSETDDESSFEESITDRVRETDKCVMDALKSKYEGERIDKDSELIKQKYLITYMKKVIEKLPMSQEIIDASADLTSGDEFLKMYSIAKTCVHSELHLKKLVAFNSIFDMASHLLGKGIHDHYIVPYLKNIVAEERLDAAYESFREALSSDDNNTSTELHCIAYLIQNEMEKNQPLKIPNPIFNRFTQQVKAASQYVTTILSSLASKPILPELNKDDLTDL